VAFWFLTSFFYFSYCNPIHPQNSLWPAFMAALSYLLDFFFCLGDWCIWVFPSYDSYVFQYSLGPAFTALNNDRDADTGGYMD
jgi:hypothetical protein